MAWTPKTAVEVEWTPKTAIEEEVWTPKTAEPVEWKSKTAQEVKPPSVIERIKEHPFKAVFQPISRTLGRPTVQELYQERFLPKIVGAEKLLKDVPTHLQPAVYKATAVGMVASVADLLQTPFTYVPLPVGRALGKLKVRGVPLEQIAKLPITKRFFKDVDELGRYFRWFESKAAKDMAPSVRTIIQALKEAKPTRKEQEALYTAERAKRLARLVAVTQRGEKGYQAQLAALKGKLPRVQFRSIRGRIAQTDIDDLFNTVEQSQNLLPFEKITTKRGLAKLLGEEGGVVPTEGELKLLSQVFPDEFVATILSKRPFLQRMGQKIADVLNVPRALMASFDLSAPLRQGVFLVGRPRRFFPAFRDMFKYFFSDKAYQGLMSDIQKRPTYALMRQSKLPLTKIGSILSTKEEAFMSNFAEKLPLGIGKVVKMSERAYTGFLNKLRADVFDDLVRVAQKQRIPVQGKLLNDIATFIGAATGRGKLPPALERSAVTLNATFFSPRLMSSRLSLLRPDFYIRLSPVVRKEALKSLFTFAGTALSTLGLAKMGGADVGVDPRSTDFGKIKIGETRYDILGGFQQYLRLAAQLITGENISSITGVKVTVGEGYKPLTRAGIIGRFIEAKEAPVASFVMALLKGRGFRGEKLEVGKEVGQRFVPMVIQDMYDLYKDKGWAGVGMGVPAIFGVGMQTYDQTPSQIVSSAGSVLNSYKELLRQGKDQEARDLLTKNEDIIQTGGTLKPFQTAINKYERMKKDIEKNVKIKPQEKKRIIFDIDDTIKNLQTEMERTYKELQLEIEKRRQVPSSI